MRASLLLLVVAVALAAAGTAAAASPPTATTDAATVLGDTSAKANGRVGPNGASTSAWFEYGTTTGYGSKSSTISVGSGTGSKNVSATLSGLAAATTYHVRLVASSTAGTTFGSDTTFTTTGKPRASSSAASAIGGTTATLNGTVAPNGHGTSWYAEWGTSTAYGTKTATQDVGGGTNTVPVSVQIGGLTAGTTYHFRIVASNASGTSTSGDTTFTTAGPGVTLAVSAAAVVAGRSVRLSGTTITQGANEQVTLWAQPFGGASFAQLAIVLTGPGGTWAYDVAPRVATTYKAVVPSGSSPLVTVGVRPAVTLRAAGGRLRVSVRASVSYTGRSVLLQRRKGIGWADLGSRRLDASGTATFAPNLRAGRWTLRALVGARPGLLAGTSNALAVRRR